MNEVKLPEGYKKTEVGVIPEDWEVFEFGEIVSNTQLGGNYANSIKHTEYPLIKMGNIARGEIKLDKQEYIIGAAQNKDILNYGDILFNTRNTLELVGKVAIWKKELSVAYFNSNLMRISFSKFHVSTNFFINYLMNSKYFIEELSEIAIGTTSVAAIYSKDLFRIKLPLPSKKEQTAIATALSDVDNLIESLEKLIAKKEAIKTGAMQQLLTGKTRLPEFSTREDGSAKGFKQTELGQIPEDWAIKPIAKIVKDSRIPSGLYKDKNSYATGAGTSIIKLGDVFSNNIFDPKSVQRVNVGKSEIERYKVEIGDLIIALASVKLEGVGKVMHVTTLEEETIYDHNVALIRPINNVSSSFLSYIFHSNYFRSLVASKATQVGTTFLKASTILGFELHLPSTEEQTAIATILSDMDAEIQALQERLGKTKDIKQGMMQQLLTGKVRLVH